MFDYDPDELPYAADDIANRRIVLDARRSAAALADKPSKVRFYAREVTVYERTLTVAELDERAPGWREALKNPADHAAPGRFDMECAVIEDLDSNDEVEAYGRLTIHLGTTDRTATQVTIDRALDDGTTVTETVTVEADDLDDISGCWREVLGATPEQVAACRWDLGSVARFAEEHRPTGADPRPALEAAVRSITQ